MRVQELRGFGLDQIFLAEKADPAVGPGQVLVRMRACSLNYRDLLMAEGRYYPELPFPMVPVSDGAGEVIEVGQGASSFQPGDRVIALPVRSWSGGRPERNVLRDTLGGPLDGTLQEYMTFEESHLVPAPAHMDFTEASTLPIAALTAWSALVTHGNLRAGESVLTLGTGGVSIFALQIGKMFGARVFITSKDDEKLIAARRLGADETINYRTMPDWDAEAFRRNGRRGMDHIIEVGGAGTLRQSLRAIAPGGVISLIGVLSGSNEKLNLLPVLMNNVRVQGIFAGHGEALKEMCRAFEVNEIRPVIDRIFPFEQTREAFEYLKSAEHVGKVVIRLDS